MLNWPPSVRVFVHAGPTDLRRSFDSLAQMVQQVLHQDPLSGHVFCFFNRARTRVKMLVWDRTGYWLFYKRLEAGVFRLPPQAELTSAELALILEGLDLSAARRQKRFVLRRPA